MRLRVLFVVWCLLNVFPATGQSLHAYKRAANAAFQNKDYGAAFSLYANLLKRKPEDSDLWWKYGESARLLYSCKEAENAYQHLIQSDQANVLKFPLLYFRLAEAQKMQAAYSAAVTSFLSFVQSAQGNADTLYLAKAYSEITHCSEIARLGAKGLPAEVKHPGKEVNSTWNDFAPALAGDTLYFSSARFDKKTQNRQKNQAKTSRVLMAVGSGRAREPGRGFPVPDTAHIAHTAFTPDRKYIFFTICKDLNASDKRCELWVTALDRRNKWLSPKKLPDIINLPGYTTTHPNVGFDTSTQSLVLWFASDRPGGKGKLDIWKTPLDTNYFCPCNIPIPGKPLAPLPVFSKPMNVEGVNTASDDITPFYHSASGRLYFSSDGWPGYGGLDIFYTEKNNQPVNAGPALNSSYNDLYPVISERGDRGYFSSNRPGSLYPDDKSKTCCNDLFSFSLRSDTTRQLAVQKTPENLYPQTETTSSADLPDRARPEDFGGLPLYFDNDEPDSRTRNPETRKTYSETAVQYLARRDEYRKRFTSGLKGISAEEAATASDSFFDDEVRMGAEKLDQLCEILLERLDSGEKWEIQLRGFTSPRAESDYNLYLAKRRIKSVINELEAWQGGSLKKYLENGLLKISELSLGETASKTGISDKIADEKNSIYHPDAARERRVEIVRIIDLKF